jgi:hypothetical protein
MGKYKNWEKAAFWSADTDEGKKITTQLLLPPRDNNHLTSSV